jgi:1-deoxy-D-xylulose-5-phosphate reductoisomerase
VPRKRVAILGSTGSIGRSTLAVIRDALGDYAEVVALAAGRNVELLAEQAREFRPRLAVLGGGDAAKNLARLRGLLDGVNGVESAAGDAALVRAATHPEADLVVSAIVGAAGLLPTLAALEAGKTVALANKEPMVMAGALMTAAAARSGARILPVDSEHSAVFQALHCGKRSEVRRLVLTASGGPFRTVPRERLAAVSAADALKHPTWAMGAKITIDSATLMNKALEVIEARWLFEIDFARIAVVIHPQSIVHSLVEFVDGSVVAQLGRPDMRVPIQYALTYPERRPGTVEPPDLLALRELSFFPVDAERFPSLELGFAAGRAGGTLPAAMNAANEAAVALFLDGRIRFPEIFALIRRAMEADRAVARPGLEEILAADRAARAVVRAAAGASPPAREP